jgi:predicted RNA-binding protein Jag
MSSEYQEFTGKTVEEALRQARQTFGVSGLDDLDFEILTPGSRGVLGMGAEPARVIAAPRAALGGAAPRRAAAEAAPLPPPPARPPREARPPGRERGERGLDRRPMREHVSGRAEPGHEDAPATAPAPPVAGASLELAASHRGESGDHGPRPDRDERRERRGDRGRDRRGGREQRGPVTLTDGERAEVAAARSLNVEREEVQAAEASPEALEAGRDILQTMLGYLGYDVVVTVQTGETAKLDVTGQGAEKEALGALIGRKGERLSALQHLVNLLLSRRMGEWTRVLVDVEDYRGRRERQLREIANRAADRVEETGKMLQLEPMPALERRWIHLALRDRTGVATQSIGEEPNRRVVVIRREA